MQHYYNFTASETQISYDPYWYEQSNIILNATIGIFILVLGFSFSDFKEGIFISLILSVSIIFNTYYISNIKNKTRFIFDKTEDAFYKTTPFGKKKIIKLSNATDISTKSGSNSFTYILHFKKNTIIRTIRLTASIKNKNQSNPEVRFLEMEIIPQLESFLNLNKKKLLFFDSETCSSI
ncbi:hypothetical protein [Flavobacterium notoginsengisoli]|uniref:hypothetical protein n=1 Tax=Flavobacterium notoginsengisoli TaxID=1478199 RepID=UPI00364030FF